MKTYPPGVPCWIDCVTPDPGAAATFYGALFGWTFENRLPPEAPDQYLIGSVGSGGSGGPGGDEILAIASGSDGSGAARWRTYIAVESADDATAAARAAGAEVVVEPYEVGPAGRTASLVDPVGAAIDLWQPGARQGSAVVNVSGSWNWSNLHVPAPQAAIPFYETVFGWKAVDGMWQLPGYGDAETRARHAAAGVPDGFSDCIGWLVTDDGPPRWHVTFAHDDPDEIARRAEAAGGTVVDPPRDLGPARLTTLADPAGAAFTVSHYAG